MSEVLAPSLFFLFFSSLISSSSFLVIVVVVVVAVAVAILFQSHLQRTRTSKGPSSSRRDVSATLTTRKILINSIAAMRFSPLRLRLSSGGLLFTIISFASNVLSLPQPQDVGSSCATGIHAFFLRGQGPGDDLNVLVPLKDKLMASIPGSTYTAVPYMHGFWATLIGMYQGSYLFRDLLAEYVRRCPETKIFALGYSLGADALTNAVCGTSYPWFPLIDFVTQIPPLDRQYAEHCEYRLPFNSLQMMF